ncbi:MAG: histidine phosphatase family protein [Alphaproteobacteria bacterium]|nr:histidine phosphatase family protein [Alphaproteobacteria bacterium]
MKIIFFRHGETDSNVKNIMQGAGMDTPLNANGIKQAKVLAEKAKKLGLEKIYSSQLTRAIQTATLTAAECGLGVEPIDGVEEFHYGEVEGMYVPDAIEKYGIERVLFNETEPEAYDKCLPGGETINQCLTRLINTIEKIKEACRGRYKCVGIFSHGAVMCILYYHFFKIHHPIENCEWFEVEI